MTLWYATLADVNITRFQFLNKFGKGDMAKTIFFCCCSDTYFVINMFLIRCFFINSCINDLDVVLIRFWGILKKNNIKIHQIFRWTKVICYLILLDVTYNAFISKNVFEDKSNTTTCYFRPQNVVLLLFSDTFLEIKASYHLKTTHDISKSIIRICNDAPRVHECRPPR